MPYIDALTARAMPHDAAPPMEATGPQMLVSGPLSPSESEASAHVQLQEDQVTASAWVHRPTEAQAHQLLRAVAAPGAEIPHAEAVTNYIIHDLAHTEWLRGLMVDAVREGGLDGDVRQLLGVLFGLYGSPRFGQSIALQKIEQALADIGVWHTKLLQASVCDIEGYGPKDARCPIFHTAYPELEYPVSAPIGPRRVPCIFEAEALLTWMQISIQAPGQKGIAAHPLDRSMLHLEHLQAVRFTQRQSV